MVSELEKVQQSKQKTSEPRSDKKITGLAASWYVAMQSKDLKKKPKAIELFGQLLVAWRDHNGQPAIMERFCSHMGASLAIGQIKEGCIQCPFHHWHFDSSGKCVSIPQVDDIPPTARQTTYVVIEKYGYIWVWYGSQTPLFPLPEFPAVEDESNYMVLRYTINTKTTVRRVVENVYDHYHLPALHGLNIAESIQLTILDEQHYKLQRKVPIKKEAWFGGLLEVKIKNYLGKIGAIAQILGLDAEQFTVMADTWPSGNIIRVSINNQEKYQVLISTTPLTDKETVANVFIMVKKTGNFFLNLLYYVVFGLQTKATGLEDIPLWSTMNPNAGGCFVKHDLGVLKYRKFYQSWVERVEYH
jgi:nitrite reductase/ring-hydroxylating ferredoxin subunit